MSVYSGDRAQAPVVVWAYWVAVLPEVGGFVAAEGAYRLTTAIPFEPQAEERSCGAPDRWIVELGISGARIEHGETAVPLSGQAVARRVRR